MLYRHPAWNRALLYSRFERCAPLVPSKKQCHQSWICSRDQFRLVRASSASTLATLNHLLGIAEDIFGKQSSNMVLLSATQATVEALKLLLQSEAAKCESDWSDLGPGLADLAIGDPITHTQVIAVSKLLKKVRGPTDRSPVPHQLDSLLRGSKLYYEPPKPKQEPVSLRSLTPALLQ